MICEAFDLAAVPFPFVDGAGAKRRPAVAVTTKNFNLTGHTVFAMVTTKGHAPWPGDTDIRDYKTAGLHLPCLARLKLFTLDNRLIVKKIGRLSPRDSADLSEQFSLFLPRVRNH